MARGGEDSLFKKIYKALEQRIGITNGIKQFCSTSIRVASHLSNNSSFYNSSQAKAISLQALTTSYTKELN
jgi:hypothetical protein